MDQSFSRHAIASILLVLLVPFEVFAIIRDVSDKLPVFLVATISIATPLGAIVLDIWHAVKCDAAVTFAAVMALAPREWFSAT